MTSKLYLISICIIQILSSARSIELVNGKIKITTGTTAGCSDTVRFISDQLVPAYEQYGDFLDLEFVPWGRTTIADGIITCQFGVFDCWANRLHRCVLNFLKGNPKAQLDYMACEFALPYPALSLGSYVCAREAGMSLVIADYCVNNPNTDSLDEEAQAAAAEPMEIINFVPSIVFNDVIDVDAHSEARERLSSMICSALAADPETGVANCEI